MPPEVVSGSQTSAAAFELLLGSVGLGGPRPSRNLNATTADVAPWEVRLRKEEREPLLAVHSYQSNPTNQLVRPWPPYMCWGKKRHREKVADYTSTEKALDMVEKSMLETSTSLSSCWTYEGQISSAMGLNYSENQYITDQNLKLLDTVSSFQNLREDWGEIGSIPPAKTAIIDAILFVNLLPRNATKPQVSVAADGEINFFWRSNDVYIDIGFFGDGMIDYYASVDSQGIDEDASLVFSGCLLPRNLAAAIKEA